MKFKTKKYLKRNLLDNENYIRERCDLIEFVSSKIESIPEIEFSFFNDHLIYKQEYVYKCREDVTSTSSERILLNLSKDLDKLYSFKFVHGDINYSNVIYNGKSLKLIDLEPSFRQYKNGHNVLVSGLSFRSCNDFRNKKITSETDKIGFYFLCNYYLNRKSNYTYNRRLFRDRIRKNISFKIPEKNLVNMSFKGIYESITEMYKK